jgi:hypothetical protein
MKNIETKAPEEKKPTARSAAVAAGYLLDKVTALQAQEEGAVAAARLRHKAKVAKLVAKAPADVQALFFKLSGKGDE